MLTIHFHGTGEYGEFDLTISLFDKYRITAFSNFDDSMTCIGNYTLPIDDNNRVHMITDFDTRYGEKCERNNFILKISEEEYEKLCRHQTVAVALSPKDSQYDWNAKDVTARLTYGECE